MKSIRLIALSAFLTVGAFCTVLYTSCSKDACKDVTCSNGGTCNGGNCVCVTGYEGTSCETLSTTKFIKSWSANDVPVGTSPSIAPYNATIVVSSAGITDANIGNFSAGYFTNAVVATVNANIITIASQQPDNDGYSVSGTGTYNTNGQLTWNYTITQVSSGNTISYNGTWQ